MSPGDRVKLIKDCRDVRFVKIFPAGTAGMLVDLYRVQDGIEVWRVAVGDEFIAVRSTDLKLM